MEYQKDYEPIDVKRTHGERVFIVLFFITISVSVGILLWQKVIFVKECFPISVLTRSRDAVRLEINGSACVERNRLLTDRDLLIWVPIFYHTAIHRTADDFSLILYKQTKNVSGREKFGNLIQSIAEENSRSRGFKYSLRPISFSIEEINFSEHFLRLLEKKTKIQQEGAIVK